MHCWSKQHASLLVLPHLYPRSNQLTVIRCFYCVPMRWQKLRSKAERDALEVHGHMNAVDDSPFVTGFALEQIWQLTSQLADPASPAAVATEHGLPYVYEPNYYADDECYVWQPAMTPYGWRYMWMNVCLDD